jgi:predicted Kef-type K+ transport protein
MHESALLLTLTYSLAAALVLGFVTQRLGLSPIVGYLLASLVFGLALSVASTVMAMRHAGADAVFSGEGEVALAMTEHVLGILGATSEQIDRERQRVRKEVFPGADASKTP